MPLMLKLTIEELQEIVSHRNQTYVFFDVGIDCLIYKMKPEDFHAYIHTLYDCGGEFLPFRMNDIPT